MGKNRKFGVQAVTEWQLLKWTKEFWYKTYFKKAML